MKRFLVALAIATAGISAVAVVASAPARVLAQDKTCGYTKPNCVNDVQGAARCIRNADTTYTCAQDFCAQPLAPDTICKTTCLTVVQTFAGTVSFATGGANLCAAWKAANGFPP